jgi:hypothetical protein
VIALGSLLLTWLGRVICCWCLPAESPLVAGLVGLTTIFFCHIALGLLHLWLISLSCLAWQVIGGLASTVILGFWAPQGSWPYYFFLNWNLLLVGQSAKLLLDLTGTVILGSESHRTHDYNLLSCSSAFMQLFDLSLVPLAIDIWPCHGPKRTYCFQQFLCSINIRYHRNRFVEPLNRNEHLLWLCYPGSQASSHKINSWTIHSVSRFC